MKYCELDLRDRCQAEVLIGCEECKHYKERELKPKHNGGKYMHERIGLHDTTMSVVQKMSEGNPSAITVCLRMLNESEKIDPFIGGLGAILMMDTFGIHGPRIWMLYKDVCNQDLVKMLACLRACQMGFISQDVLNFAIDNYGKGLDVEDCLQQVKERLPEFGDSSSKSSLMASPNDFFTVTS